MESLILDYLKDSNQSEEDKASAVNELRLVKSKVKELLFKLDLESTEVKLQSMINVTKEVGISEHSEVITELKAKKSEALAALIDVESATVTA
jgi:hypothetical protein